VLNALLITDIDVTSRPYKSSWVNTHMVEHKVFTGKGAFNLREFQSWSGLGRTKILEEIAARRLCAVKVGRRLLIPVEAAKAWLAAQPAAR
jgi:excisionase family DNA binding protein